MKNQNKSDFGAFIAALKKMQVKDPAGFQNELKTPANDLRELFECYFIKNNKAYELVDLRHEVREDVRVLWAYFAVFVLKSSSGEYEFHKLIKCDRYSKDSTLWDLASFFDTMKWKKRVQSLSGKSDYYRFSSLYCRLLKEGNLKPRYADFAMEVTEFKE